MYEFTEAVSVELKIKNDCSSLCFVCVYFKGISRRGEYQTGHPSHIHRIDFGCVVLIWTDFQLKQSNSKLVR